MQVRFAPVLAALLLPVLSHCGTPTGGTDASATADSPAVTDGSSTLPDTAAPPIDAPVPLPDVASPPMDTATAPPDTAPPSDVVAPRDVTPPRDVMVMPPVDVTVPPDGSPGNPMGTCPIPMEAAEESIASPRTVVGTGTPASCTSDAFVNAVARGGVITFNCGPDPVTITLNRTAKIVNNTGPRIVIDGGNRVTLSGGNRVRILYMNTCDQAQVWTTSHCQNQDHPQLTVQNLTFVDGNASMETTEGGGGGAIFVRGGRFKVLNSRFYHNTCAATGPDVGGGAIRVLSQFENRPVYVVNSTFGGTMEQGNFCSNGGGLSSIGVSYTVLNSVFRNNRAIGMGANPMRAGTPGGGSGGAIYNDGNTFTLTLCGTEVTNNTANEGGGAIFFVSNNRTGTLVLQNSVLRNNPSMGFETRGYPGIFYLGMGNPMVTNTILQ